MNPERQIFGWEGEPDDTPPFEQWDQLGYGQIDLRVFVQDRWWVDVRRVPHEIAEMSIEYLTNVAAMLVRLADQHHSQFVLSRDWEEAAQVVLMEPLEWMEATVLMQSVRRRLSILRPDGPGTRAS